MANSGTREPSNSTLNSAVKTPTSQSQGGEPSVSPRIMDQKHPAISRVLQSLLSGKAGGEHRPPPRAGTVPWGLSRRTRAYTGLETLSSVVDVTQINSGI